MRLVYPCAYSVFSPFIDPSAGGYAPDFQLKIQELKAGGAPPVEDIQEDTEEEIESESEDEHAMDLQKEQSGAYTGTATKGTEPVPKSPF